jgi:hypothetical protein
MFIKLSALGALGSGWLEAPFAVQGPPASLYNGVILPSPWPPLQRLSAEPVAPPYLVNPPSVIPIDVGRQLFVDDFLIESSTLRRVFHRPNYHRSSPVLVPDRSWEKRDRAAEQGKLPPNPAAMVFSDGVFFDPRSRLFKMWYMGGYAESTCLATSEDGIRWTKPNLDVVSGTNIVDRRARDSNTVWLDLDEADPARRYKMALYSRPALAPLCSADGIHWRSAGRPVTTGDRSTMFFNPFRRGWVYSIRAGGEVGGPPRHRLYWEQPRFGDDRGNPEPACVWVGADKLDPPRADLHEAVQLYNLDCAAYESVLLGLFTMWRGESATREKPNDVCVGFSRDGFHWSRPDRRPFLPVSDEAGAWNRSNVQSAGGCCLVVGDELHFYVSGRAGRPNTAEPGVCATGLATLRRDGFASMEAAGSESGTLTTRPVKFTGEHLFVNADARGGQIGVEVLDEQGRGVSPFTEARSTLIRENGTRLAVRWDGGDRLSALRGRVVRFRFHVRGSGRLYAFWVSASPAGTSRGFVAGGGPGFAGPLDA